MTSAPARVGAGVFLALVLLAALVPGVLGTDPHAVGAAAYAPPSGAHLLGTDDVGRDVAARVVYGTRGSVLTAAGAVGLAIAIALIVGTLAPVLGGWVEQLAERLTDAMIAIPRLPLLIVIGTLGSGGRALLVVTLGLLAWAPAARVIRQEVLHLRTRGHVLAARGFGAGPGHLVRHHVAPVVGPLLVAEAVTIAASAVLLDAALTYLGLGPRDAITWGGELQRSLADPGVLFSSTWTWWALPNGLAVTGLVVSLMVWGTRRGAVA